MANKKQKNQDLKTIKLAYEIIGKTKEIQIKKILKRLDKMSLDEINLFKKLLNA